ncbi:MAG: hypothetical protein QNJ38_21935 [Prochloraceae cyanobacterium]|nr:hypothetical protein [Prochloraceae cyanobacterium]
MNYSQDPLIVILTFDPCPACGTLSACGGKAEGRRQKAEGRIKKKDRRIAGCLPVLKPFGFKTPAKFEIFGGLHLAAGQNPPLSDPSALCPLPSAFFNITQIY